MVVLRAIGRFFKRIGRWIKDTAWIQPLLIVGGIFAIIFSIPYLTKWVKSWFNDDSAAQKYYSNKKLSLKNADKNDGESDADKMFDFLMKYESDPTVKKDGQKKYGEKFFLTLVQEDCSLCEESYGAFKALEDNWGKESFEELKDQDPFKMYTIYVDTKNSDGDNLFEKVYEKNVNFFEDTISYMSGEYSDHPYAENCGDKTSYVTSLENLLDPDNIATPVIFLIDTTDLAPDWTSSYGVRETIFSVEGTAGTGDIAKGRFLRDAWTNTERKDNIFSANYKK